MSDNGNSAGFRSEKPPCDGCGYDGPQSHCYRCHRTGMTLAEAIEHLREVHGYEPRRWPDGGLVIVDKTPKPDDFGGEAG